MEAFLADESGQSFAKVVDRLLASRHYSERWGRHWLDLARYSDGKIGTKVDKPFPNAFRYRDWVISAFHQDMPYDRFVKAQLAADLLPEGEREGMLPGLGFHALGPRGDERVDVTARTFLALTVGCAQCHDHKYDPIPTEDFYSLQGVFESSEHHEYPLVADEMVAAYKDAKKRIDEQKELISGFLRKQTEQLTDILLDRTAAYMEASFKVIRGAQPDAQVAAAEAALDLRTLERWIVYLRDTRKEHPYLKDWDEMMERGGTLEEAKKLAQQFQKTVLAIHSEKKGIDDRNYVTLGGKEGVEDEKTRQFSNLEFLDLQKWYLWRDLASEPSARSGFKFGGGVFYYGEVEDRHKEEYEEEMRIDRFLGGAWRTHLERQQNKLAKLEEALPPLYPFLHGFSDSQEPKDVRVAIRGEKENLGKVAPRRFLQILNKGEPKSFTQGSGRLQLAEAIASPDNPLTARVMVNRVWQRHFGAGIVRTPSNFGQLGEPPTHPQLLDYLAAQFVESGWSIKALHREIMLSATYALSVERIAENLETDPGNRLFGRANLIQRLDAEALRDSILAVSGNLDRALGGPPIEFGDENRRRTVYARVSRTKTDRTMTMLDFPDPNGTSERRMVTVGPLQRLYFLNSSFVMQQAQALAERIREDSDGDNASGIRRAYHLLFSRPPTDSEVQLGLEYLQQGEGSWAKYAQVLLASSEFSSVN